LHSVILAPYRGTGQAPATPTPVYAFKETSPSVRLSEMKKICGAMTCFQNCFNNNTAPQHRGFC